MQSKINEYFGEFGGCFVPEMLHPALKELGAAFLKCKKSKSFHQELNNLYKNYVGRPTPLYFAENLSKKYGAKIFLKNEGQALTGAHKINHCVGQILLAKYMKKKRIIAETGAGQHGLATAAVSAKFGLKCTIYMGEVDYKRQRPNVFWMENLGAEVVPVTEGSRTLKDAVNFALKDFLANSKDSYYLLGSALGPSPYPEIIAYFQKIIGEEVKKQLSDLKIKRPDYIVACVGGGSNAIGIFHEFLNDKKVKLIGVEAGGEDLKAGRHAARFQGEKRVGIFHGYKSYFLQTKEGQLRNTHSISAGLDYPGVSPIHANLYLKKRVFYSFATDKEAISAFQVLARNEGIIPALESAHALAYALKLAKKVSKEKIIVVNISGRGDKDLFILQDYLKDKKFKEFLKELSV